MTESAIAEIETQTDEGDARAQFVAGQAEMGRIWFDNVLKSGVNVEDYIGGRRKAYLDRWREAGRFIPPGSRVLDVGGGFLFPELLEYFRSMRWDYWFFDIDADVFAASRSLAAEYGVPADHFHRGLNHELHFEDDFFDAIFSSHCVEHSMKLSETFWHLNRILKPGGNLTFAVPFGWEKNPNHPYFFLEDEWVALVEDSGFRTRVFQIGCEYPEIGYDLFVAAQKVGPFPGSARIDPERYRKTNFTFRDFHSSEIEYRGENHRVDDYVIMERGDWRIQITLPAGVTEVLPIFMRHDWSGVVAVRSGNDAVYGDLFRQNKTAQPLRLRLSRPAESGQIVEIAPVGRNEASFGAQGVFVGYMAR